MALAKIFLFKRSNGLWYIIYDENGHRRWKSTGSALKGDALQKLTEFKELTSEKPVAKTLLQYKEEFLSYARSTFAQGTVDISSVYRNLVIILQLPIQHR